jgi:hypothetical protein
MIIWDAKGRQQLVGQGQFFCPHCDNIRPYKQKRVSEYFTLFVIPLFKIKTLGEYVECQGCKNSYDTQVLEPGSQQMQKMVAITKYSLLRGTPLDDVKSRLVGAGANDETVDLIIQKALSL